jgi:AcrR family transcriptional regulator
MVRPRPADSGPPVPSPGTPARAPGAADGGSGAQRQDAKAGAPPPSEPVAGTPVAEPPVARLAANQLRRMRRIVDAAVELAEQGGFDAVRLRDVAERSDVALGTLYKYFRSKEDILLFALNEEVSRLEQALAARPPAGATPYRRVVEFFRRTNRALIGRAPFARALIRALTGSEDLAVQVAAFQLRMARLVAAALRGEPPDLSAPFDTRSAGVRARDRRDPGAGYRLEQRERDIAQTLMHTWFSALVGWAAGLHNERAVVEQVRVGAELILGPDER